MKYEAAIKLILGVLVAAGFAATGFLVASPQGRPAVGFRELPEDIRLYSSGLQPKDFFDTAYSKIQPISTPSTPTTAIVAHHLLVADKIAQVFETLGSTRTDLVILLSPNHFSQGRARMQTGDGAWDTPYGQVRADASAIMRLRRRMPDVGQEDNTFVSEHGIAALTPFVKRSFPNARLLPIVLDDSASREEAAALGAALADLFPKAVVIASIDMSHYLPEHTQVFHDTVTELAIGAGSCVMDCPLLEIDSNPSLVVLQEVNRVRETETWVQTHHGSSIAMGAAELPEENTSHILGYFLPGTPDAAPFASFHFVGDIMLDRGVRTQIAKEGVDYPWARLERFLSGVHIRVGNLEGTISERASIATDSSILRFTMQPAAVAEAAKFIDVVSLANNHSMDFGGAGETESHEWLEKFGLPWFGRWQTPDPRFDASVGGLPVALIGYHQFKPDQAELIAQIEEAKEQGRFVIVFPHWGAEYLPSPDSSQKYLAKIMVDAGADLVIGAHPHVVQTVETVGSVPVIYSMGNFIFDQRFSETQKGLTAGVILQEKTVTLYLMPVWTKAGQPAPMNDTDADALLASIAERSPAELRDMIRQGILTFPLN